MGRRKKKAPKKIKQAWRPKKSQSASTSAPPPPPPPWTELPRDITANILQRIGSIQILESAQKVCTTWRSVCKDPAMWRNVDMGNLGDLHDMPYDLEIMCQHAVDRSQGQLVSINIEYFGTDELLEYVAERSGQLRCLTLACCYSISAEGLNKAVKRFPLLEELHIFLTPLAREFIEMVGHSCPLLKSFTLQSLAYSSSYVEADEEALAVAKNMPELRHLRLLGNTMTNEGLKAILDGCPHLESLDLRQCFHVSINGDLERRCSKQIKVLKRPYDSTEGFVFDSGFHDSNSYEDYYPSGCSDLDYPFDYYDLDYDDFTQWGYEDSDYEDIFGIY